MPLSQDRLVLGALVLSESAWLFAAFGVMGTAVDKGGSPLGWFAVLAIMAISLAVGFVAKANVSAIEVAYLVRSLIGAAVIYVAVGAHLGDGLLSMDLAWLSTLASGGGSPDYSFTAVSGAIVGGGMWWRGGRIAGIEYPIESLGLSFRLGMFALAIAVIVDVSHTDNLNTLPMVFIFFVAGLGGLSAGHLWPQSQGSTSAWLWPRVMAGVVVSVVVIGAAASLLKKGPLSLIGSPVLSLIDSVARLIFYAIVVPITYAWSILVGLVLRLFGEPFDLEPGEAGLFAVLATTTRELAKTAEEMEEETISFDALMQVMSWMFAVVIVAVLLWVLGKQLRRMSAGRVKQTADTRESVREEGQLAQDIAKLLSGLLPDLSKLGWRRSAFSIPGGAPGVVDAIRLYYDILTMAEIRGVRRRSHETPAEHRSKLEEIFPVELVRQATDAFVRAFYGNHPTPVEQLSAMRTTLKGLKWEEEQS